MVPRRLGCVLVALVTTGSLSACDYTRTAKAQELCGRYDDLAGSVQKLQDQHPLKATAQDVRRAVEDAQERLDRLQAVAEGRLDTVLTTLRYDLSSELESAVDNGNAALDTSRPAIEDALENVNDSWARVQALAAVQCGKD